MSYRGWLLVVFTLLLVASGIAPHDRRDWLLEHVPTAAALWFLVWYEKRPGGRPLRNTSYTLLFWFSLLHLVGAHYLYSRVPYAEWSAALFGVQPSSWLVGDRNHYDRLVHLCFGLFVLPPIAELVGRHVTRSRGWTLVVAVAFVGVMSKLYELLEWWIALTMSPEAAESYNGQQGDVFDAHKDMALAFGGSLASALCVGLWQRRTVSPARPGQDPGSAAAGDSPSPTSRRRVRGSTRAPGPSR